MRLCQKLFLFIFKISAIIKQPDVRSSLIILDISKEGKLSQISYVGPRFYFVKCRTFC